VSHGRDHNHSHIVARTTGIGIDRGAQHAIREIAADNSSASIPFVQSSGSNAGLRVAPADATPSMNWTSRRPERKRVLLGHDVGRPKWAQGLGPTAAAHKRPLFPDQVRCRIVACDANDRGSHVDCNDVQRRRHLSPPVCARISAVA
jgi:hypothetical protein